MDDSTSQRRRRLSRRIHLGSVRARTTAAACLVVGAALVIGSVGLLVALRHGLVSSQDSISRATARELTDDLAASSLAPTITDVGDDGVAQVVSEDDHVLAASSGLSDAGPISELSPDNGEFVVVTLHGVPDDSETEDYRVWATTTQTPGGTTRIYVGDSLESVSEAVQTVRRSLYVGVPLLLILVGATTWILVGRALRPVEDIRTEVARISERRLDRRVPVPGGDDEVARLAATMNAMLDRLEQSATRQREFVADASHELQSPLASLRAQLEVSLAHPDGVDWTALAADLLDDSDRMELLVRDLLFLARADAGAVDREATLVDLDLLVVEEAARLGVRTRVDLNVAAVAPTPVNGDAEDLRRLIRNLLDNAVSHATHRVAVELREDAGGVLLAITDDGQGISADDRARVFERFVRLDDARVRGRGGTGLGLSIALTIAKRHGGDIAVDSRPDGMAGARFVVRLPSSDVSNRDAALR
jgi:signal transduction histidine kinase